MENNIMNVSSRNATQNNPLGDFQVSFIPWVFFNTLIIVFGSVGNVLVILAYRNPRMKTVTNLFIANLAFADLNVVLINVPMNIIKATIDHWPFGAVICKVVSSILGITLAASVGSLIAIAADRHRAIVHPLKPRMRTRHAFYIIIAIWIAAVFIAIPVLVFSNVIDESCIEQWPEVESLPLQKIYTYFIFVTMYILPLGAISGLYFMIYWNLMGKAPLQKSAHRARISVVRMLIMVVVVFGLCWLPFHVVFLFSDPETIDKPKFYSIFFAVWLTSANSSLNPIIYAVFNLNYRREFARILTCGKINVGKYLGCDTSFDDPRSHVSKTTFRKSQPLEKLSTANGENVRLVLDDDDAMSRVDQKSELNGNDFKNSNNCISSRKNDEDDMEKCITENENVTNSNPRIAHKQGTQPGYD